MMRSAVRNSTQPKTTSGRSFAAAGRPGLGSCSSGMDVPTNYGPDYASAFAELYERIASDEGVALVPGFMREVGSNPTLLQADGLHPTAEGQQRLAETLEPYLRDLVLEIDGE